MKVMLDAGHGGYDNGTTYGERKEKDDVLDITLAVGDILQRNGIEVAFTRVDDSYDSPLGKAKKANGEGADLLISFHRNTCEKGNYSSGVEAYIKQQGTIGETLANSLCSNLEKVGFKNSGVQTRKDMAILRKSSMPSLMLLIGYMNNDQDNAIFDGNYDMIVETIAKDIYKTATGNELELDDIKHSMLVNSTNTENKRYFVQIGLFREINNAKRLAYPLEVLGYPVRIVPSGDFYAVQVGDVDTLAEGTTLESDLKMLGYDTLLMAE